MNLIIIGKASLASLGLAAIVLGSVAISQNTNTHFSTEKIEGFFSVKDRKLVAQEAPLKCKIDEQEFDCGIRSIVSLTLPINNQITIPPLAPPPPPNLGTTVTPSKIIFYADKFYEITIDKADLDKWNNKWTTTPVTVSKNGNLIGYIYAVSKTDEQEIDSFVGQSSDALADTNGHKCFWESSGNNSECKIFPFVVGDADAGQADNASMSSLTFSSTEIESTEIKKHHYYLIKFTDDAKKLSEFTPPSSIVYLKDSSTTKVTFSKLAAVKIAKGKLVIVKKQDQQ